MYLWFSMRAISFILVLLSATVIAQDDASERIMRTMSSLNQQAAQSQNEGNYAAAIESRRQLISLMETVRFPQSQLAQQLSNLASLLNLNGNPSEAQALCERALQILEEYPTDDPVLVAVLQGNMGNALRLQGDLVGARQRFETELSLLSDLGMTETHFAASAKDGIGAIEAQSGNLEAAKALYEEAIPVFLEISDESHPTTAKIIKEYQLVLQRIGN